MTILALAGLGALGLLVGTLIGCIGIGGVILVPSLSYLGGIEIPVAIAAAMMGYLLTGGVGTVIYARKGSIRWSLALWLCIGAMPAALAGAWTTNNVPPVFLELVIAALTASAGLNALRGQKAADREDTELPRLALVALGVVTGYGSAITGTGGPLILVPILMWLNVPLLTAIGLSQAVQLPIATLATVGNFAYGEPNLVLGALLAVGLAFGSALGANLAHSLPVAMLRRTVAVILIAVGASIIVKIVSSGL